MLVLGVVLAAPLGAQTAPATPPAKAPAPLNDVMVAFFDHDFSANLKSGASGKLNVSSIGLGGQYKHDWDDNHLVDSWAYIYSDNNFSGASVPVFGNVQQLGVNGYFAHDFSPQWGAFGYVSAGLSAETAISLSRGGQIAVALGPTYQVNKDLSLALGPMYYTRMEDTNTWIPMADLKWNFMPQWDLHAYAGVTNGVTVSYDVFNNRATVVETSLEYNSTWFHARDSAAGARQAVNQSDTTFKVGVRQALSEQFFVSGYVSGIFSREYQYHTNGHSANSFNADATIGLGCSVGFVF
jgi:hypothetical protein